MITDIVGSIELIGSLGDVNAKNLVMKIDRLVRAEVARCAGSVVDHTGDGNMASFASARDAIDRGIGTQRAVSSWEPRDPPIRVPARDRRRRADRRGRQALRCRREPRFADLRGL